MKRNTQKSIILCLSSLLVFSNAGASFASESGLSLASSALNSVYRALPAGAKAETKEAGRSAAGGSGASGSGQSSGSASSAQGGGSDSPKEEGEKIIGIPEESEIRQPARIESVSFGEGASLSAFSPEVYGNYVDVVWGTDRLSVQAEPSEGAELLFATYAGLEDESIIVGPLSSEDGSFSFNYHETYRLVIVARYPDDSELELASSYTFLFRDIM